MEQGTRPHMVTKRRCVWNKTFPLGHFVLHFTTLIMFLCEMAAKDSSDHLSIQWPVWNMETQQNKTKTNANLVTKQKKL